MNYCYQKVSETTQKYAKNYVTAMVGHAIYTKQNSCVLTLANVTSNAKNRLTTIASELQHIDVGDRVFGNNHVSTHADPVNISVPDKKHNL